MKLALADKPKRILVSTDATIDIPTSVAVCPYCGTPLHAIAEGWTQRDDGTWRVDLLHLDCESEPAIDTDEWGQWLAQHSDMPYVYMLPVHLKVEKWLADHYDFDLKSG